MIGMFMLILSCEFSCPEKNGCGEREENGRELILSRHVTYGKKPDDYREG